MAYSGSPLQRQPKSGDDPPDCTMSAGLGGFVFTPEPNAKFLKGPKYPQLLAMVLKKLLGERYGSAFRDSVIQNWGATPLFNQDPGRGEGQYTAEEITGPEAQGSEAIRPVTWAPVAFRSFLGLCAKLGKPITLS